MRINYFFKIAVIIASVVGFSGCTALKTTEPTVLVSLVVSEDARLRFSGKGAGAGMMLMSSMGPAGIAVGIAIDEGIAKEIRTNLQAVGVEFNGLVEQSIVEAWPGAQVTSLADAALLLNGPADASRLVVINEYGFKLIAGEERAAPYVRGSVRCSPGALPRELQGFAVADDFAQPLDALKTDGGITSRALTDYLNYLFKNACPAASG